MNAFILLPLGIWLLVSRGIRRMRERPFKRKSNDFTKNRNVALLQLLNTAL